MGMIEYEFRGYVLQPITFRVMAEDRDDAYERAEAMMDVIEGLQDVAMIEVGEPSEEDLEELERASR